MSNTIVYVITNLFRIYFLYRLVRAFFCEVKVNRKIELLWCGMYFVSNTGLYLSFHLAWVNIVCNLIGIVGLSIIYTREWKMNLFVTTMVMVLGIVCDIISTIPFIHYVDGETVSTLSFILIDFLILICELIVEKIISVKRKQNAGNNLPLIIVPLCSIVMIIYMVYVVRRFDSDLVVVCIGLLIINFLVLYLYNKLLEAMEKAYENKILKEKIQMYSEQLEIIKQSENRVETMRHDMRHHLMELKIMAEKRNDSGIQHYIDSMADYMQSTDELNLSGNIEVDSLLNYLIQKAKKELKEVTVNVTIPQDIENTFEINIILGNLLENAIEAANSTYEKILNLNVSFKKGVFKVEIENSYNGTVIKSKSQFLTTKKDTVNHGLGLKSVQNIVEKYDGVMEIITDDLFRVKMVLYM